MKINSNMEANTAISFVDGDGIEVNAKKLAAAFDKANEWTKKGKAWVGVALENAPHVIEDAALIVLKKDWVECKSQVPQFLAMRSAVQYYTKDDTPYTLTIGKEGKGDDAKPVAVKLAPKGKTRGANANKGKGKAKGKSTSNVDKKLQTLFNEFNKAIGEATATKLIDRINELVADKVAKDSDK